MVVKPILDESDAFRRGLEVGDQLLDSPAARDQHQPVQERARPLPEGWRCR